MCRLYSVLTGNGREELAAISIGAVLQQQLKEEHNEWADGRNNRIHGPWLSPLSLRYGKGIHAKSSGILSLTLGDILSIMDLGTSS